ncbi:hypothetical protein [Epibacterium ulvae]|uniref:hypothetical protein n=1 Tax=Epibacterium ulvae TaxID=1156985 RepID=UPI00249327DE|nr:hypothetical protein [Epibacterium ulvae]
MTKDQFIASIKDLAAKTMIDVYGAELWIGCTVANRLATQDTISRAEIHTDLEADLQEYKEHPTFAPLILKALKQL